MILSILIWKIALLRLHDTLIFDFDLKIFLKMAIFHVIALIRYVIFHFKIFENSALRYVILKKFVRVIARVIFFA